MRLRPFAPLVGLAVLLSACQDPSGVGLGLIGEEGTDPNVVVLAADTVRYEAQDDVTGGFATTSPAQQRALVGAVMDPLLGDARAEAYLDFVPSATVPEDFFDDPIVGAELRLSRDYAYGDTTATLALELYQIDETWTPVGAPADTSFAVGARLGTYDRPAADTLLTLPLPSSWVDAFDETLRSDSLVTAIEGFQLRLPEGAMPGVVVGFNGPLSRLRLRTAQDTVDFPISELFTHIERGEAPPPPDGLRFLRDGDGQSLAITFPLDTLGTRALANATLRLNADPETFGGGGPFKRALPETLALFARNDDGGRLLITTADRDDQDRYTFTSGTLTSLVQQEILDGDLVSLFEIAFLSSPTSLDAVPLVVGPEPAPDDPDRRPRFALTLVPISN